MRENNLCHISEKQLLSRPYKEHNAAAAKSLQSCPTRCDPRDGSPPGSPAPGILQARTLEWVAIFFSNAWKWKVKVKSLSRVRPSATPWTAARQAPPPMGFSRQEYWSGVPLPSPKEHNKKRKIIPFFKWARNLDISSRKIYRRQKSTWRAAQRYQPPGKHKSKPQ